MRNFFLSLMIISVGCCQWLVGTADTLLWNVTSDADRVCMLMTMAADITHPVYRTVSTIPQNAIISSGDSLERCPVDFAVFEVSWKDKDFNWTMGLSFNVTDSKYALTEVYGTVVNKSGSVRRDWSYHEFSYPEVSTFHSIVCDYLFTSGGRFTNIKWQPFAQNTDGDFGPGEECQKKGFSAGTVFGIIIVAVIAIAASLLVAVFVQHRRG